MKYIYYNNKKIGLPKKEFKTFIQNFRIIKAGGGLVINPEGEYLMIFRHNKWDLPKGKKDKGEDIRTCALREVSEETGVSNLTITAELPKTYHLFVDRDGEIAIKKCYWYEMRTDAKQALTPQVEESITKAEWMNKEAVITHYKDMFGTIQQTIENYFKANKKGKLFRLFR